jgi:hypothetical protein
MPFRGFSNDRRDGPGTKRVALVLALLAAFLLQSFLTATHVHDPAASASSIAAGHDGAQKPAHRRAPDPATNCPVCHAVAQSGHYLASAPIVFVAAASTAIWLFAAAFRESIPARRSHAWNSRAPPR